LSKNVEKLKPQKFSQKGIGDARTSCINSDPGGQATFTLRAAWVISQVIKIQLSQNSHNRGSFWAPLHKKGVLQRVV